MEKKLLNEINQFRFLTDYNTKKTLTENKLYISENIGGEIETLFKSLLHNSVTLKDELKTFLGSKRIIDELGNQITKVNDFETALSVGRLSEQTIKDLKTYLINTSKDKNVVNGLIENMIKSEGFITKYTNLSVKDAFTELTKKGYSVETANKIINKYSKGGGKFRVVTEIFDNILRDIKADKRAVKIYNNLKTAERTEFKEYIKANIEKGHEIEDIINISDKWINNKGLNQSKRSAWKTLKKNITTKRLLYGGGAIAAWALATNKWQLWDIIKGAWHMGYDETKDETTPLPDNGGGSTPNTPPVPQKGKYD